ncbi:MAG: hypothetical protein ACRDRG_21480 [Pseudonocardiaceae bacterium]
MIGAGLLAWISSFLPWYITSVSILGIERSASVNAWNAGFGAWFSVLLLVAAGGWVLVSTLGRRLRLPVSGTLIALSLAVLAFVTIVLRWATFPDATNGLDEGGFELGNAALTAYSGPGSGLYLGLLAAVVAMVAALLTFRAAGRDID